MRRTRAFHPLPVAAVERLTDEAVAVTFAVPDDLRDEFAFEPGQHLTLRATIDGEDVRQSYSICQPRRVGPACGSASAARRGGARAAGCRPGSTTASRPATSSRS